MIDVEKEINKIVTFGEPATTSEIFDLSQLVRKVTKERDKAVELAIRLETEWRNKDGWVGDRRPEFIRQWVLAQLQKERNDND
jgi:hypothetical protein